MMKALLLGLLYLFAIHPPALAQNAPSLLIGYTPMKEEQACKTPACAHLKKDPLTAAALNLIPYGYGSFYQEDNIGGYSILVVDGLSTLTALTGFSSASMRNGGWGSIMLLSLAGLGFILGRLIGFTAPFLHYATSEKNPKQTGERQSTYTPDASRTQSPPPLLSYQISF